MVTGFSSSITENSWRSYQFKTWIWYLNIIFQRQIYFRIKRHFKLLYLGILALFPGPHPASLLKSGRGWGLYHVSTITWCNGQKNVQNGVAMFHVDQPTVHSKLGMYDKLSPASWILVSVPDLKPTPSADRFQYRMGEGRVWYTVLSGE